MVSHFLQICQADATEKKDKTINVHIPLNFFFIILFFMVGEIMHPVPAYFLQILFLSDVELKPKLLLACSR